MGAIGHGDEAPYRSQTRSQLLDKRRETNVKKKQLILCMIDDVLNLLWEQPWIDGVTHRPYARDTKKYLQVPVAVPGQGSDSITLANPKGRQCPCKLSGTTIDVGVSATMGRCARNT